MDTPPPRTDGAIAALNDGSDRAPRLRADLNLGTIWDLPAWTAGPQGKPRELYEAIRAAGFEGVQGGDPTLCVEVGLRCTTFGTVRELGTIADLATLWCDLGFECSTLHVGSGIESDDEAHRLFDEVLEASVRSGLPMYVETHRATLTQDIWRTVQLVERFPELRFNGDFSHWYTGLEMTYGDFDAKLEFIQPVFDRTVFLHGRIGTPGCIQIPLTPRRDGAADAAATDQLDEPPSVAHFRQFWTGAARGFLRHAAPGDVQVFAPELLPSMINYAPTVPRADAAGREEESDRWLDALRMTDIMRECFAAAANDAS